MLDDSNLWIEGKKLAGKSLKDPNLTPNQEIIDPRYRIDLGTLIEVILSERANPPSDVVGCLFGSKPPPNDSVWKAAINKKWTTKIFDKQQLGSKSVEKEVDTAISAQASLIAKEADEQNRVGNTTIVFITGNINIVYHLLILHKGTGI